MAGRLDLPTVLHALSDDVRLRIVRKLADAGEAACGTFGIRMPKSSLSHHFKVLRDAGVIESRAEGNRTMNVLRREALDDAFPGLLDSVLEGARKMGPRSKRRRG